MYDDETQDCSEEGFAWAAAQAQRSHDLTDAIAAAEQADAEVLPTTLADLFDALDKAA